ncbi:MAG: hypothetical protein O2968_04105 [Acidobacteria bacterium]|nr:hypothetical protein [Acidobacteriota bacterium]
MRSLRLNEVPEHWMAPIGPYRQAPPEYGGEWWLVTPFSDPKPWLAGTRRPNNLLPEGFDKLFGQRPRWTDFRHLERRALISFEAAKVQWDEDLDHFKSIGIPPGYAEQQISESTAVLVKWLLGKPTFYEGRFGWMGRFLESDLKDYDSSAWQIINYPHHVVSTYQITSFRRGIVPPKWHPFVPGGVITKDDEEKPEDQRSS